MELQDELNHLFYNLPGSLVSEKKKHFNQFINTLNSKIPQDDVKASFVLSLTPRNKLEELLKIDLMLYYQLYHDLLKLLKEGNILHIAKILKNWKFFEDVFKNIVPEEFVNEILPCISFNVRQKVINRISKTMKDVELADKYYGAIEEKYGIISANILAPCCSIELIKLKIEKYNFPLGYKQLMTILKRDPHFLKFYLATGAVSYSKNDLSKILLQIDEELFWIYCEEHKITPRFGRRYSKKLLKKNEEFSENNNRKAIFKDRQMYDYLRKNPEKFKRILLEQMPEEISDHDPDYFFRYNKLGNFTRYVSKNRQYKFLNDFINEKYGFKIEDNPRNVTEDMLLLMPTEIREKLLEEKTKMDDSFVYFQQPEISIPFLFDKIKHSSDMHKRMNYANLLYKTCSFHKNDKYLLEVLKYMERRHRNDKESLKNLFECLVSWPDIDLLSREHWTYIDTIEKLLEVQNVTEHARYYLEKRISNLIENTLDIDEHMTMYLEHVRARGFYTFFSNLTRHRKFCLVELKKYLDRLHNDRYYLNYCATYCRSIHDYNTSIKESSDAIPILNYLPLVNELLPDNYGVRQIIFHYLPTYYTELNPIIWQHRNLFFTNNLILYWYMLHRQNELLEKVNLLFQINEVIGNKHFIRLVSMYSFRGIPERISEYCDKLFNEGNVMIGPLAIRILSALNHQELLTIIQTCYPPPDGKINVEEPPEKVKIQEALLTGLKNLFIPSLALPHILAFAKGDYLKYSLQPLYSILTNISEKESQTFLKRIHNAAVSVRKHAIHLSKIVLPTDDFCAFVKEQSVKETDSSLKTILFRKALECAAVMPITKFWELLKATMHGIDKEDVTANDLLLEIEKIPKEYRAEYVTEVYDILNNNPLDEIRRKKYELMQRMPVEIIDQLKYDLLETFISETLFKTNCDNWARCVFYTTGLKQEALFNFTLQKFKDLHIKIDLTCSIPGQVENFKENFREGVLKHHPKLELVQRFVTSWFSKLPPDSIVHTCFQMRFILTFSECRYDVELFAVKSHDIFKQFLNDYDPYLFEIFAEIYVEFVRSITDNLVSFVTWFLNVSDDVPTYLLAIKLLSYVHLCDDSEDLSQFRNIIHKFMERPELSIKTFLRHNIPNYATKFKTIQI